MVASAGETDRDLAASQFTKNCEAKILYSSFKHYKIKLYNIYDVL